MLGLIDVGGGNRGAFGAGVLDYCMDHQITTDYCIGVSAGSANCVSYIAKQRGRNLRFYTNYNLSNEFLSLKNIIKNHSLTNLDYIYATVSNEEGIDPLDYKSFKQSPQKCFIVATDAKTGEPIYFGKEEVRENDYRVLAASCNIPGINQPYTINEHKYYDGGLSDPIPIDKALNDGCDKVIVILTLPKTFFRNDSRDRHLAKLIRTYPKIKETLEKRSALYNRQLEKILALERTHKVLIISPGKKPELDTLGKERDEIIRIYNEGYHKASKIESFLAGK